MRFRGLVLLIVVAGVAAMAARPSFDTDTWWHLRTGQWIVDNRQAPHADPFSSTMHGAPWSPPGWLAQVVMLGFFRAGGGVGLTAFTAILVAVGLLLLWRLLEGPLLLRAAVLLLAAATSAVYWAARPHVASFALAAFTLWALEQWRRGKRPWVVWLLPVAMAFWVNLHGGFAIGFLFILMYLASDLIDLVVALIRKEGTWNVVWRSRRRDLATLGAVFGLGVAAAALNPYGPSVLAYPFRTVSIPVLQAYIQEWQPPDVRMPQLLPFLVMLLLLIVALGVSRKAAGTTELVTASGWTAFALLAVRNVPIFALAAAPVLARHFAAALSSPDSETAGEPAHERRGLNSVLGAAILVGLVAWIILQTSPAVVRAHNENQVPVDAVATLRGISPNGRLLNDYNWGGYLLWELYPEYPSFVDGRTDLFSPEVFEDYLLLWTAGPGWERALEKWDIGTVLLPDVSPLVGELRREGWLERFADEDAVILMRPEAG